MQREAAIESIQAIERIAAWVAANPQWEGDLVLVGGWAVHSWAPYYFSIDIDLVVKKKARDKLKREIESWGFYPVNPRAGENKNKWQQDTASGTPVILDLAGTGSQMANDFARDRRQVLPWGEAVAHSAPRRVPWDDPPLTPVLRTCDLDLLFLYKLKALDDRTVRLVQEADARDSLAQKRLKDAQDVWALLQLIATRPELALIREYFTKLPFLRETLRAAPSLPGVMDAPARGTVAQFRVEVETFLSLL